MKLKGKAWKFGDDVDTDAIIPARHLNSSDPAELAGHCMEGVDPQFVQKTMPGDFIVAGKNFGCGSSREHAPIAIKHAGIAAVIAGSFARIFYRNAFNMGLPIFESQEAVAGVEMGDELETDLDSGAIFNLTKGQIYQAEPIPEFMQKLLKTGGLIAYVKKQMRQEVKDV
ncbi:MAG: 3-isopropylmalate dehydratase small subunit [Deltaproteobacteria bacterium]|nr:3-isopropylmalate dehydratase small subunit [Deltaproteobacteria bacterium]